MESAKKSILVISADESIRQAMAELAAEKYTVTAAADETAAGPILEKSSREISVVILDLQEDARGGAGFLRQLLRDPRLASVPVIAVSGNADPEEESTLLELGASDYISKPVLGKVLLSRIKNLLRMKETAAVLTLLEKDDLTGVYSKQAFFHHTMELLEADPQGDYDLMVVDIDKFKLINAIYGEARANELLKALADYLKRNSRAEILARYGADRFIWIQRTAGAGDVLALISGFAEASPVADITVRCGVYAHVDRRLSMIRMCDKAIFALKSIKIDCRKTVAFYDGPVSKRHYQEQLYAARFPEALKNREFVVWYQPKYDPYSSKVMGAEALVRWRNPDGSFKMPGDYLRVFEANGMIGQLDEYVFRCVCRQQRNWKDAGLQMIPVSVNLSRNSMHNKDIAAVYSGIAREYGIDPRYLPIEITETTATDSVEIQKNAEAIHRAGFPLHMDDFGSGHSSLHALNVLDFDVVKLDKGLIDFIGDRDGDLLLMYIMALSTELGLRIVAEGVETRKQLEFLMENGCDQIQGYYYSRPLPVEEFEQKVADHLSELQYCLPAKENLYVLSLTSHMEKLMTQRMLPRIPGGFLIYEEGGEERIVYSNEYLWKLFGCENEQDFMEHVHGSFRGVVCPEELARVNASIRAQLLISPDGMEYVEYHIVRKDGVRVPVLNYGRLERGKTGNLFYVFLYRAEREVSSAADEGGRI